MIKMKEIEVKAKVDDLALIEERLIELGCNFNEPTIQKDIIFIPNNRNFLDIVKGDIILRIRYSNSKYKLTLKKQLENELDNIEKESFVSDPNQIEEIIKLMGFKEGIKVNKVRKKTKLGELTICLDKVESLGEFIEIEKISNEDSLKIQEELFDFLKELGIKKESQVFRGYDTLLYIKSKES